MIRITSLRQWLVENIPRGPSKGGVLMAEYIRALEDAYGFNESEAKKYIRSLEKTSSKAEAKAILDSLVEGFKKNARRCFYED